MESFLIALNAVVPFLFYIGFGYLVRRIGLVEESFLKKLNQMIFKAFFPILMFCNLYSVDLDEDLHGSFILTAVLAVLIVAGVSCLAVPKIVRENARRGVVIQALYRSNAVLFMLPLAVSIYGADIQPMITMVLAFIIPIYNVLAVIVLETFRGGKIKPGQLLLNILKTPMIAGAIVGFLFLILGIRLPSCLMTPLNQYSNLCTPLAMFVLGGTLKFSRLKSDMRQVVSVLCVKMVVIPAVAIAAGVLLQFSKLECFVLFSLFATPVATASYTMAQNMGGDGDLAGELVVVSTACSVVTLFLWILLLGNLGLI